MCTRLLFTIIVRRPSQYPSIFKSFCFDSFHTLSFLYFPLLHFLLPIFSAPYPLCCTKHGFSTVFTPISIGSTCFPTINTLTLPPLFPPFQSWLKTNLSHRSYPPCTPLFSRDFLHGLALGRTRSSELIGFLASSFSLLLLLRFGATRSRRAVSHPPTFSAR